MAKYCNEMKVIIEGELTDELKMEYNKRLAIALYSQFGREICIELVKVLQNKRAD